MQGMSNAARKLLEQALVLPEEERLEIVTAILASVDGAPDEGWDAAWSAEADRRIEAARARGDSGAEWSAVRSRVLARLGG